MRNTVEYKGIRVVYSQIGSGQPLVLLHGFLEDRTMWNDYAQKLSADFKVISIDLLGQGETENIGYVHSMEEHAAAVATVLFTENVQSCTMVGHSMGGYVALALAEKQPDLIKSLVLFHSTAFPDPEERKKDRERVIGLVKRNQSVYVNAVIPSLFAEHFRSQLSDEIQQLITTANGFSAQGIIANIRGMMERQDRSHVLKDAAFKKLIIHGELDSVITVEDVRKLAGLNPNISLKIIPTIGHMGHLEASENCLYLLTDFCQN